MNVLAVREATKWAADYCRAGKVGGAVLLGGEGGWGCSAEQGR